MDVSGQNYFTNFMNSAIWVTVFEGVSPRRNPIDFDISWIAAFVIGTSEGSSQ